MASSGNATRAGAVDRVARVCSNPGLTRASGGLNVPGLRKACSARGLARDGTRAELVARLRRVASAPASRTVDLLRDAGAFTVGPSKNHRRAPALTIVFRPTGRPRAGAVVLRRRDRADGSPRSLGSGAAGDVYEYRSEDDGASYAVKVESNDRVNDRAVVEELRRNRVSCGQIGARYIGQGVGGWTPATYTLLEMMDSELSPEFVERYRRTNGIRHRAVAAVRIVEEVRRKVLCLLRESGGRYVYTDMKMENVFYREDPVSPTDFVIKLGDLGSMVPTEIPPLDEGGAAEYEYTFTYPCLPYGAKNRAFFDKTEKERCLAFQLGMLLAALLGVDIDSRFKHTRVRAKDSVGLVRRRDPPDESGYLYTKAEFDEEYGRVDGDKLWDAARATERVSTFRRNKIVAAKGDDTLWRSLGGDSETKTAWLVDKLRDVLRPVGLGHLASLVADEPAERPPLDEPFVARRGRRRD